MRLKAIATAFAVIGALALLAAPADAAQKKKRVVVVDARGHTLFTSRDEDGRTRTRIIIQKRSYLDPGTEVMPGDRNDHDYASLPTQRAGGVLDNTAFGGNQSALPGPFSLPSKNNPFLKF
jgi:predicted lipoprotein with Yx(FWY)xxD motif